MCEVTEREAVDVIACELSGWVGKGGSPWDYTDDTAMDILVRNGIRPSGLSADLDWLLARAQQRVLREMAE